MYFLLKIVEIIIIMTVVNFYNLKGRIIMEFTNDIRFNRKPKNNKILRIIYSGDLYKSNSNEVSIVYGFGENWEKTTEQKMIKTSKGFLYNILMENYNTFNFCFKNENNIWDNNNSFNYITPIELSNHDGELNSLSDQESQKVISNVIDKIVNSVEINENVEGSTIDVNENSTVLDTLVQELFKEYDSSDSSDEALLTEKEFNNYFNEIADIQENSKEESFKQISTLFDNLIEELESKSQTSNQNVDVGIQLSNLFENIFDGTEKIQSISNESYTPTPTSEDAFGVENDIFNFENKNFDLSIFNYEIENVEAETENNFNFENKTFDLGLFNLANEAVQTETKNNKEFSISESSVLQTQNQGNETSTVNEYINTNSFSDSFYDDEDTTIHHAGAAFQNIVENTVNELNSQVSSESISLNNEEFKKQSEEFDKAISEYAEYFDNLIDEIISGPTSSLSTSVSNEEVIENEQTDIAVSSNNVAMASSEETSDINTDGVAKEYALYDYKQNGILSTITRRFKLIFSSLFTKLPKLFGREKDTNQQ